MGEMNASANNYAQSNVKALNVLIEKQWSVMAEESSEKYLDVSQLIQPVLLGDAVELSKETPVYREELR